MIPNPAAKPSESPAPPRIPRALQRVFSSIAAACNPKVVPIIGSWMGHRERALSVAELATLWHPPTASLMMRTEAIMARWLTVPQKAFVDADNPRTIVIGHGRAPTVRGLPWASTTPICAMSCG